MIIFCVWHSNHSFSIWNIFGAALHYFMYQSSTLCDHFVPRLLWQYLQNLPDQSLIIFCIKVEHFWPFCASSNLAVPPEPPWSIHRGPAWAESRCRRGRGRARKGIGKKKEEESSTLLTILCLSSFARTSLKYSYNPCMETINDNFLYQSSTLLTILCLDSFQHPFYSKSRKFIIVSLEKICFFINFWSFCALTP